MDYFLIVLYSKYHFEKKWKQQNKEKSKNKKKKERKKTSKNKYKESESMNTKGIEGLITKNICDNNKIKSHI